MPVFGSWVVLIKPQLGPRILWSTVEISAQNSYLWSLSSPMRFTVTRHSSLLKCARMLLNPR